MKRKIRALICILICLTMTASGMGTAAAAEVGASGYSTDGIPLNSTSITLESGKTYTISNIDELYCLSWIVNNGTGSVGEGATVKLLGNIQLNEGTFGEDNHCGTYWEHNPTYNGAAVNSKTKLKVWNPIGSEERSYFSGTFDGCGFTISGLYCDKGMGAGAGLFGNIGFADIRNLNITNSYFRGILSGGIAGRSSGSTIRNCTVQAIVVSMSCGGGIVGNATAEKDRTGNMVTGTVENCVNRGSVLGGAQTGFSISFQFSGLGGIAGNAEDISICGCTNEGTVSGDVWIGAIAGKADVNVQIVDCVNTGTSGDRNQKEYLAGVGLEGESGGGRQEEYHNRTLEVINGKRGHVDEADTNRYSIGAASGNYIADVVINGQSAGAVKNLYVNEGDRIQVYFAKDGETWQETLERDKAGRPEEEAPMTEAQKAKTVTGVQNTTIQAQTVKMYNGAIRVTWKKSAGYKADCFQIFRSTKKTTGYGKTPIYTTKTGKATYYTNSKALKKGIRYYYKVRGMRVIDGKTYYTKWSNICYRTATKTFR
ncbi:MAG: hypothetical protein ACI4LQ_10015 [Anaerovoracaceae bacterium]